MKLTILSVCSLILLQSFVSPFDMESVATFFSESKDIADSFARTAQSILPTPTEFFENTKLLAGLPLEYLSSSIDTYCTESIASKSIVSKVTPIVDTMKFQFRTACKKYSVPLLEPEGLLKIKDFDVNKKTVIVVTGWMTSIHHSYTIEDLSKAYNCRGDVNFLALDAASYVGTFYGWASLNTEKIGEILGENLVKLAKVVPLENIHLIGHSLGAHICGAAGRTFHKLTSKLIPRITGLDPAKPCFSETSSLAGLKRGVAEFIDVIHTNTDVLGKKEAIGDVDFYPEGMISMPTGCFNIICAHDRAWVYFAETIYPGNEYNFMAKRCATMKMLRQNECIEEEVPMGYAAPSNLRGTYILDVKGASPHGMNGNATREDEYVSCGTCSSDETA